MNLSRTSLFLQTIVFVIFVGRLNAGIIQALSPGPVTDIEKGVSSVAIQAVRDEILSANEGTPTLPAKTALKAIGDAAEQALRGGASIDALKKCLKGYTNAIQLASTLGRKSYDALDFIRHLAKEDPEAAIELMAKGIKKLSSKILESNIPVQRAPGAALAIAGEIARPGLSAAIQALQYAGSSGYEGLRAAEEMLSLGLRTGGEAADQALKAAHEIIKTTGAAVYRHLITSAHFAFGGIKSAAVDKVDLNHEIAVDSEETVDLPAEKSAIDKLNSQLEIATRTLRQGPALDAFKHANHGLVSSLKSVARAFVKASQIIDDAAKQPSHDGATLATVQKAISAAHDAVISHFGDVFLGLGAAGEVAGEKAEEGLVPAFIAVGNCRFTIDVDFKVADRAATIGLKAGGIAGSLGLNAASETISAAGSALFKRFVEAGEIALKVLTSL